MLAYHILLVAAGVAAVPLNINLGAYSPALVVGDGEISFDSSQRAEQLMETLATGATPPEAQQNGQQGGEQKGPQGGRNGGGGQAAERRDVDAVRPLVRALHGLGKRSAAAAPADDKTAAMQDAMDWIKRDIAGFREALGYAREAQKDQPKIELGSEAAGVGIIVNAGENVNKESAANGALPSTGVAKAKRSEGDVVEGGQDSSKVTLVAITEV